MRGVCYLLGKSEEIEGEEALALPSYKEVKEDHRAFAEMTRLHHKETNPLKDGLITQLAEKYQKKPGQIILNWHL